MARELPSFDELKKLAQQDPEAFENLRKELCDEVIEEANEAHRQRLRGLQFQVDMERRRAKNPLASCIKISEMMHQSIARLRKIMHPETPIVDNYAPKGPVNPEDVGKVLKFSRRQAS